MADPKDWNGDEDDSSFETSTPEANRAIEAGQGVGARELAAQRDPTETAEHDPFKEQLAEDDDA
jgi:hypothetical protein